MAYIILRRLQFTWLEGPEPKTKFRGKKGIYLQLALTMNIAHRNMIWQDRCHTIMQDYMINHKRQHQIYTIRYRKSEKVRIKIPLSSHEGHEVNPQLSPRSWLTSEWPRCACGVTAWRAYDWTGVPHCEYNRRRHERPVTRLLHGYVVIRGFPSSVRQNWK